MGMDGLIVRPPWSLISTGFSLPHTLTLSLLSSILSTGFWAQIQAIRRRPSRRLRYER